MIVTNTTVKNMKTLKPKMDTLDSLDSIKIDNSTSIQYKIDGDFQALHYNRTLDKTESININGKVRVDYPALNEVNEILTSISDLKEAIILSELYAIDNNKICQLNQYRHILHSNENKLHLGLHTIHSLNGKVYYEDSLDTLSKWFSIGKRARVIPYIIPKSREEIETFYKEGLSKGYEGIVVRRFNSIWKYKPLLDIDAVIIGFNKRSLWSNGFATSMKLALVTKDNKFIEIGHCSSGIGRKLANKLYQYAMGSYVTENRDTVFVKPEIVVKVRSERPYRTKNVIWEYSHKHGWISTIEREYYTLRSARFIEFRIDKEVNNIDLRTEQIPEEGNRND